MNPDNTYTQTLRRAIEAVGSEAKLAEALRTSPEVLQKWLSGELKPPSKVYLAALEITRLAATTPIVKRR
jgi:ribosome-binding protein aMBF1 (putative translation factor)